MKVREEYGEGLDMLLTWMFHFHFMDANEMGSHVFIDYVGKGEFWTMKGYVICSNSAKCCKPIGLVLHSADGWPEPCFKRNPRILYGYEVECSANGQVKHLKLIQVNMLKAFLKAKCSKEQAGKAGIENNHSNGFAEHHQGRNTVSGNVYGFQTAGSHWLQRIWYQLL